MFVNKINEWVACGNCWNWKGFVISIKTIKKNNKFIRVNHNNRTMRISPHNYTEQQYNNVMPRKFIEQCNDRWISFSRWNGPHSASRHLRLARSALVFFTVLREYLASIWPYLSSRAIAIGHYQFLWMTVQVTFFCRWRFGLRLPAKRGY